MEIDRNTYDRLTSATLKDSTKPYPVSPCFAKVVNVYDGDTFTCLIPFGDNTLREFHVRMLHYDAPEMRSKDEHERVLAHQCKDMLSKLIYGKTVQVQPRGLDKYGRLLGEVNVRLVDEDSANVPYTGLWRKLDVNQWMLDNAPVKPYNGRKQP